MNLNELQQMPINTFFGGSYGVVKYVRVAVSDEAIAYRFCYGDFEHSGLVNEGETAQSAGFVYYDRDAGFLRLMDQGSMSLKLGPQEIDGPTIAELVGLEFKSYQ